MYQLYILMKIDLITRNMHKIVEAEYKTEGFLIIENPLWFSDVDLD